MRKTGDTKSDKLLSTKHKKIYFIRFVESQDNQKEANITVLNEIISLPKKYNHQFLFVEWDIEKEQLFIHSEYKKTSRIIYQTKFRLNI